MDEVTVGEAGIENMVSGTQRVNWSEWEGR